MRFPGLSRERIAEAEGFLKELWPDGIPREGSIVLAGDPPRRGSFTRDVAYAAERIVLGAFKYQACALMRRDSGGNRRAENAIGIPGVWLDLDLACGKHAEVNLPTEEEAFEYLGTLPLSPTLVLHSGGGLYVWWLFREPWIFESDEERHRAAALVAGWQEFVLEYAAAWGWKLDNTSSLSQILRPEGSLNTKYSPPRRVERIRDGGPRWNPCSVEEWVVQDARPERRNVDLPECVLPWIAEGIKGLGVPVREVRKGDRLSAILLETCPACGGVQRTRHGTATWTAHIGPLSGALRCKRQTCEAAEGPEGGMAWGQWTRRFLPEDVVREANEARNPGPLTLPAHVVRADKKDEAVPTVTLEEADNGAVHEVLEEATGWAWEGNRIAVVEIPPGVGKTRAVLRSLQENQRSSPAITA